jgi:hypothetical protein
MVAKGSEVESRKPVSLLVLVSYIALAASAVLFTLSLFIGSSIVELKSKYGDAVEMHNFYYKMGDDAFKAWVECKNTSYNIDDCDKWAQESRTASELQAPFTSEMIWSEAEIGRRTGYVSNAQTLSVSALLLSGLLFLGNRIKLNSSQSGQNP